MEGRFGWKAKWGRGLRSHSPYQFLNFGFWIADFGFSAVRKTVNKEKGTSKMQTANIKMLSQRTLGIPTSTFRLRHTEGERESGRERHVTFLNLKSKI